MEKQLQILIAQPNMLYFIYQSNKDLRYACLRSLLIDEISMTSLDTFDNLNKACKVIKQSTLPFCGIPLLLIDDCLQLLPVKQLYNFPEAKKKEHMKLYLDKVI